MQNLREYLPADEVDCVVYHSPCADGFAGAYTFWKYLKSNIQPDNLEIKDRVTFIPFNHSMSELDIREKILPQISNRNVVFVDVCPGPEVFLDLLIQPNLCVVLDHHESALKTTEKFANDFVFKHCHIDQTRSGCILAHEYCYPDEDPPLFLKCIEDRDIWAWKMDEISRPFTEAFHKCVPFDFEAYSVFEDPANVHSLVEEGKVLMKYKDARIMELVGLAMEAEITINEKTYAVYIINTAENVSDLGHILSQTDCKRLEKPCDFAMMWHYDQIWGKIKVSLRSDGKRENPINVSEIARQFGGGGHPSASGFTISNTDLFLDALNSTISDKELIVIDKPLPKPSNNSTKKCDTNNSTNWVIKFGGAALLIGLGFFLGKRHK